MKRQYARVAWFYDARSRLTEELALRRLLAMADVTDGCRALEVAVGTGHLFAHARRPPARSAPDGTYQLQEASAYHLPFTPQSFEVLFNAYLLDRSPAEDHTRLPRQFVPVLKPGGKTAFVYFSLGWKRAHWFWYWTARHFSKLLTDCRPIDPTPSSRDAGFPVLRHAELSQGAFPSGGRAGPIRGVRSGTPRERQTRVRNADRPKATAPRCRRRNRRRPGA